MDKFFLFLKMHAIFSELTPAMDDFISGLMMACIYMGNYYKLNLNQIYKFNSEIIGCGLQKITRVSNKI
ncbi:DUF2877 domain-containing protein [Clostridium bowmanii]|uniref:oxamate carbamoyltransferase subunit AllH family protein n=1 Tax=Clostridium bowmanii TaxID=132925 RepID=UPI001C0B7016|nr:DUF2877 domain-containing protein [Clostridium bowmanii]MBU3188888.1 DUF2877 domain-containing protein [Clostridium bowmanii]MCA1073707.1 DUF2877 domain-containing protein [Clostridium bowmanii]